MLTAGVAISMKIDYLASTYNTTINTYIKFGVLQQTISAILIKFYTLVDYLTNKYYNLSITQFFVDNCS